MRKVSYVTVDSIRSGVGTSQVWEYVRRLPDLGHEVSLTSFEPGGGQGLTIPPGVTWLPSRFGKPGTKSALIRFSKVLRTSSFCRGEILHARSDIPALAAIIARHPAWIWDVRSFWREQRLEIGAMQPNGFFDRVFQRAEMSAAREASAIVCLSEAGKTLIGTRFGEDVKNKTTVIPTAVDTNRFTPSVKPLPSVPRVLLSGSINGLYDGDLTLRFLRNLSASQKISATWVGASTDSSNFSHLLPAFDTLHPPVPFANMPDVIAGFDVGLVICRIGIGAPLTGAMPTKAAEFLSAGIPIVASRGTGDLEALLDTYKCGAVVRENSEEAISQAVSDLLELWDDPGTAERCRACAIEVFDIDQAVKKLSKIYSSIEL